MLVPGSLGLFPGLVLGSGLLLELLIGLVLALAVILELHALPVARLLVPGCQEHILVEALVSDLRRSLGRVLAVFALGWLVHLGLRRVLGSLLLDRFLLLLEILAGDLA